MMSKLPSSSLRFYRPYKLFSRLASVLDNRPRRPLSVGALKSMALYNLLYEHVESVERLGYYQPGTTNCQHWGPLHGRYRVVHKLGHGSYSTIWLARDEPAKRYVALKVCTADLKPRQIGIISTLIGAQRSSVGIPGRAMIPPIWDELSI